MNIRATHSLEVISWNIESLLKNLPIIDLWIGTGRNAYFLAEKWFSVIGIDNNSKILENISHSNISKICADINEFLFENTVSGNFLASFSLRFTGKNFIKNIRQIQKMTPIGGVNIIVDFIDDGSEFVQKWKNMDFYWLNTGELQKMYALDEWEIIEYYEEKTKTRLFDESWKSLYCLASFLIAKRKRHHP